MRDTCPSGRSSLFVSRMVAVVSVRMCPLLLTWYSLSSDDFPSDDYGWLLLVSATFGNVGKIACVPRVADQRSLLVAIDSSSDTGRIESSSDKQLLRGLIGL
jgi:hypothetical protein